jgi:hypothetical protein
MVCETLPPGGSKDLASVEVLNVFLFFFMVESTLRLYRKQYLRSILRLEFPFDGTLIKGTVSGDFERLFMVLSNCYTLYRIIFFCNLKFVSI